MNPYPILHTFPRLLQRYPNLAIMVISMHDERGLIRAVMECGASGYILKDDGKAIQELSNNIQSISNGGVYLSEKARKAVIHDKDMAGENLLTDRQLEVLSLCVAYPDATTVGLAQKNANLKLHSPQFIIGGISQVGSTYPRRCDCQGA